MNRTTIQLWATIDAEMDNDSTGVIGLSLCELVMQHLLSQQIPVSGVISARSDD